MFGWFLNQALPLSTDPHNLNLECIVSKIPAIYILKDTVETGRLDIRPTRFYLCICYWNSFSRIHTQQTVRWIAKLILRRCMEWCIPVAEGLITPKETTQGRGSQISWRSPTKKNKSTSIVKRHGKRNIIKISHGAHTFHYKHKLHRLMNRQTKPIKLWALRNRDTKIRSIGFSLFSRHQSLEKKKSVSS